MTEETKSVQGLRRAPRRLLVLAALALPLIAAAPASAQTRYATPAGSPTDATCAASTPCTLDHAVAVGQPGNDVQLAPGDYAVGAEPSCVGAINTDKLNIHGTPGLPRPRIIGGPATCVPVALTGQSSLSDVEVDGNDGGGHALTVDGNARAFRVLTGGSNGTVWVQHGGLLVNSVARAGASVDAIATYNSVAAENTTVANVTALGQVSVVADTGDQAHLNVHNTVATGNFHVFCDNSGGQGQMIVSYSHGAAPAIDGGAPCGTFSSGAGNSFGGDTGLAAGGWDAVPGGPLQDAGSNALVVLNDPAYLADLDGDARPFGSSVDIGADEIVPHSVNVAVTGMGTVTAPGISCPGDCAETYPDNALVSLSPSATAGSIFAAWAGDCAGASCQLTMDSNHSVTASFNPSPPTGQRTAALKKCKKKHGKARKKCKKKAKLLPV
jgi:hypothetical protein